MDAIAIIISLIALGFSTFTFWDSYFRFKLDFAVGRQSKLSIGIINQVHVNPAILMSLTFTNSGGKTNYIDDVKLRVAFVSDKKIIIEKDFVAMREYDTLLGDGSSIKQTEILPIVIVGKTTTTKKYVFLPTNNIQQAQIPKDFELNIRVYTNQRGRWKQQKEYEINNLSNEK